MKKLEFNKPYLLAHFLSNVDRIVNQMRYRLVSLEQAVAESLLPIREIIISYYTADIEINFKESSELSIKSFIEISSFLMSFITNEFKRNIDVNEINNILDRLGNEDREFLETNNDLISKYTNNWIKSRELDEFKNNKFSEN